jgi:hypothetical protein
LGCSSRGKGLPSPEFKPSYQKKRLWDKKKLHNFEVLTKGELVVLASPHPNTEEEAKTQNAETNFQVLMDSSYQSKGYDPILWILSLNCGHTTC